jgi:hypothetical protein
VADCHSTGEQGWEREGPRTYAHIPEKQVRSIDLLSVSRPVMPASSHELAGGLRRWRERERHRHRKGLKHESDTESGLSGRDRSEKLED